MSTPNDPSSTGNPPRTPTKDEASGYAEKHPRNRDDARQPEPKPKPNPDEGGLDREPESMPED